MNKSPEILIVDDDEGHAILVRENLIAAENVTVHVGSTVTCTTLEMG